MQTNTSKEVVLGGRTFVPADTDEMTFDQFAWIQSAVDKAGLGQELMNRITPAFNQALVDEVPITVEEAALMTESIISRSMRERAHLDILAGILVEKGKDWTYEGAVGLREFFGTLRGAENIHKAEALLGQAILSFFWSGLDSMLTSQKSSKLRKALADHRDGSGRENDSVTSEKS